MMYWWGNQMTGWGWALITISSIAFWALLLAGTVALVRYSRLAGIDRREPPPPATAERLLAERYARGEIDEAEYRRRLDTLEANGARSSRTR
jgi:putative membrane protein